MTQSDDRWSDALRAAVLLAVDPVGLGGVRLRAAPDARREAWLGTLRAAMPPEAPLLRMPLHISDERLLGGIDLGATLQTGRVVAQAGLLARCDGGVLLVAMAERLTPATAARLAAVLDTRELTLQREGQSGTMPARLGVVALDEGAVSDEALTPSLADRLGLQIDLDGMDLARDLVEALPIDPADVLRARAHLSRVHSSEADIQALCETAEVLGVASLRAPIVALQLARVAAAWEGRDLVDADDLSLAARLVLAPRATRLPAPPPADDMPEAEPPPPPPPPPQDAAEPPPDDTAAVPDDQPLQDQVLQAALASIPPGLLAMLVASGGAKSAAGGRAGAMQASRLRGRPYGSRRGDPRAGARLHLIDTLRAAAPWQALRRRERGDDESGAPPAGPRVLVRRDDFHVTRFRQRRETTTLFVVDASGSAALHRLAEAKGAVELLLADCYVRRDRVALIAFRAVPGSSAGAELLLPPTRSLVRAKRCLAGLPGGGGTPLAAGLDTARTLAEDVARRGGTPLVVLLTDGRANIARDGTPGRAKAHEDALASARLWAASGISVLWLDTSPQPQDTAQHLALAMGARYLPLPHADAQRMSQAVRAVAG